MNQQLIQELTTWNPKFKLDSQVNFHFNDNRFYQISRIRPYKTNIVDKINSQNGKYQITEEHTEKYSLLHMYSAGRVIIDSNNDVNLMDYTIVINVCDTSKYKEWSSEQYGVSSQDDIEYMKFNESLIGDRRFMGQLDLIECHGSKCRLGLDGYTWCTDCFGELDCHNLDYFLKKKISFSDVPMDSILYADVETIKIDWSNEEHIGYLKEFAYYIRSLNDEIKVINKQLNDKMQTLSDYSIISEFIKGCTSDSLIGSALQRVIINGPEIDIGKLESLCIDLQNESKILNSELSNAISCTGEMPKPFLELMNISVQI